jgi:hypothetical protein
MAFFLMNVRYTDQYWHVWMTPMILYCYLSLRRGRQQIEPNPDVPAPQPVVGEVADLVA